MPTQIHPLISYLASGSLHLAAAGAILVGVEEAGFLPPSFEVRWGDADAAISSAWAPQTQAPIDDGPLVSVLGEEHAELRRDVELLKPVAVDVLRANERPVDDAPAIESTSRFKPVVDEQQQLDARILSLSLPERLSEPVFEQPRPRTNDVAKVTERETHSIEADAAPPIPESLDRAVIAVDDSAKTQPAAPMPLLPQPTPARVAQTETTPKPMPKAASRIAAIAPKQAAVSEPPLPDELPERPAPALVARNTPMKKDAVAETPQEQPKAEAVPTATAKTALAEASAPQKGTTDGAATRGANSSASAQVAASELPPGGKPDSLPLKPANAVPPYPAAAYQQGQEGVVQLDVTVAADGTVTRLKLFRSSGFRLLDDAALTAVTDWRFTPATYRGRAIAYRVLVPVRFSIEQ